MILAPFWSPFLSFWLPFCSTLSSIDFAPLFYRFRDDFGSVSRKPTCDLEQTVHLKSLFAENQPSRPVIDSASISGGILTPFWMLSGINFLTCCVITSPKQSLNEPSSLLVATVFASRKHPGADLGAESRPERSGHRFPPIFHGFPSLSIEIPAWLACQKGVFFSKKKK